MKYLYIELNGYKRFSLNGFDHFAMTITDPLQLIIGTNGSGKSSLMSELTPFPPAHTDFTKTGSKIIKIKHNERIYTLKSSYSPSWKHSFFRYDVGEMNDGGTVSVQKDLVKHQFGIDSEINDLIHGHLPFTGMSTKDRKDLLIRLCDTNYDFAIRVYNQLRKQHRDVKGAIDVAKRKLVSESEKLVHSDEEARLVAEARTLHECLNHMLEIRRPIDKDLDNMMVEQQMLDAGMTRTAKALQNLLLQQDGGAFTTEEILDDRIESTNNDRVRHRTLMDNYSNTLMNVDRKIDALQKAEAQTIETLKVDVEALTAKRAELLSKSLIGGFLPAQAARHANEAFQTAKILLLEIFSAIPNNKDRLYSSQKQAEELERQSALTVLKANLKEQLQDKESRRKHMEAHKDRPDLQCPSCHHKFSLNYNETAYEKVINDIAALQKRIDEEVNPALKKIEDYLTACGEYAYLFRRFQSTVNGYHRLKPYWDYLNEEQVLIANPGEGLHHIQLIERDLLMQMEAESLEQEFQDKTLLLLSLKDVGGADLKTLQEESETLHSLLSEQTELLQRSTNLHTQAVQAKQRLKDMQDLTKRLSNYIQQKRGLHKQQVETVRRTEFNNAIRSVQSALASREHVLNNLSLQKGIVEHAQRQIQDLGKDEEALAILVKQMSPTEGLIAEGLLGFIRTFVGQMNSFIRKIWTYPLVVKSCDVVEDGAVDLDYQFPMVMDEGRHVVSDVSKGSDGMKEIVNLAFRLVAMKYLHLQDSPLMLDEFSKTFDEAHRAQANMVIKALVEQNTHPQLFLVSHYEASYGALSNAEICVLNGLNITTPKTKKPINSHVVMK